MSERAQVMSLQIAGALALCGVLLVSAVLSRDYPVPVTLVASLVSALLGKWFGTPLEQIALHKVETLLESAPPPLAAAVARRAIASMPPDMRKALDEGVTAALRSMHPPPEGDKPCHQCKHPLHLHCSFGCTACACKGFNLELDDEDPPAAPPSGGEPSC